MDMQCARGVSEGSLNGCGGWSFRDGWSCRHKTGGRELEGVQRNARPPNYNANETIGRSREEGVRNHQWSLS